MPRPTTPLLHEEPQTPLALLLVAMALTIGPLIVISQLAAHLRFDVVDDQLFGYFGWRIAHGAAPYVDVWDNKPPGIYWINALGFLIGADSYNGVIALCVLALLATHTLFFLICASNYFRGSAAIATVLASFYFTHGYFQGGTNRTETFLIPFELAGVLLYMRGYVRDRNWVWGLAGFCCGIAFWFKQVGLAGWGAIGLHTMILAALGVVSLRDAWRRCNLLFGGAVTAILLGIALLSGEHALPDARFAVFDFNKLYMQQGRSSFTDTFLNRHLLLDHVKGLLTLPMLLAIAAVLHSVLWFLRPSARAVEIDGPIQRFRPACPHPMILYSIWFVAAFYGAAVSPHAFRHYLLPTLAPLLLMGAHLINLLKTEARLIDRLERRAWVVGVFVLMGYLALDSVWNHVGEVSRVWVNRFERNKRAPWEVLGDAVVRHTSPTDRIQFFGYMPGAYLQSRRLNACRYVTTEKIGQLAGLAEYQQREIRDVLSQNPPRLIGMSAGDWANVTNPDATIGPPWWNEWLGKFINDGYTIAEEVGVEDDNYILFERKRP